MENNELIMIALEELIKASKRIENELCDIKDKLERIEKKLDE